MKTSPKVSVLMLAYNQENYIDEAIRSVLLQQTDFNFELVIGNDASSDRTGAKCMEWKNKYPERVVLFNREKNLGLQQNFIQTYEKCWGEYIAICEGDDYWTDRHKLQKQINFLDVHPDYSTCIHRVINYYEDKGTKSLSNGGQKKDTDIIDLAQSNYISNVSSIFRRGLFGPLPQWFAEVSTYDYAIHLLNAQHGKIHYMSKPMAVYRQRSSAIWSEAGTDKKLNIALKIRELLLDYFKEKGNQPVYDTLLDAHTQVALALTRYYESKQMHTEREMMEKKILAYHPQWSIEEVRKQIPLPKVTWKTQLRNSLWKGIKSSRAILSYFIPLPRI